MRFLENHQNHRDKVEQWLPGPWKTGEYRSYHLTGTELEFYKLKRILEIDYGSGCTL